MFKGEEEEFKRGERTERGFRERKKFINRKGERKKKCILQSKNEVKEE